VHLDLSNGTIIGERCSVTNTVSNIAPHFFLDDNDDDDDEDEDEEAEESFLKPVYTRTELFTIDSASHQIFCHECKTSHDDLPWIKNFDTNEKYFGLSQEALPVNERSSLVLHDHNFMDSPEGADVYFVRRCSDTSLIVYHPLSIPQPTIGENEHPLSRLNGIWVGTYGGHGLELLHLELCHDFTCATTVDGVSKDVKIVSNVLVA